MKKSGQNTGGAPEVMTVAVGGLARRSQTSGLGTRAALGLIRLALLRNMLQSSRFYERVAVGAIVLAALARIGKENRESSFARLAAWNKRQVQLLERQAERQAKRLAPKS